ncbi:MAG: AbrB/MazE/SpoVT family DNA-binding domain-containing protein [Bacilli bacterium]|nr:AbrB/MazE/SpoVT family DNA-binding domain-containing protein [Bacilli bacterium]
MNKSGIIRKIDELGRIVLPKELRKTLNIHAGDDFQITIDNEKIILEKYSILDSYENILISIINCFLSVKKYNIYLVIKNRIINFNNEIITNIILNIILERKIYINDKVEKNIIGNNLCDIGKMVIYPIVINSDLLGSLIIIGKDDINELIDDCKLIYNIIKKVIL